MNFLSWDWISIWNYPGVKLAALGLAIFALGILNMARNPKKLEAFLKNFEKENKPQE